MGISLEIPNAIAPDYVFEVYLKYMAIQGTYSGARGLCTSRNLVNSISALTICTRGANRKKRQNKNKNSKKI